mgnify:CR=1 FL=1
MANPYSNRPSNRVRKAADRAGAVRQKPLYCAKWASASAVAAGVSLTIRLFLSIFKENL